MVVILPGPLLNPLGIGQRKECSPLGGDCPAGLAHSKGISQGVAGTPLRFLHKIPVEEILNILELVKLYRVMIFLLCKKRIVFKAELML